MVVRPVRRAFCMKVLLHADLGPGVPPETAAKLLACADLANLGGDEETMRHLATEAAARGLQIGASPGPSAPGATDISPQELRDLMSNQITALERVLAGTEGRLGHVKLRGSLARWCDERTDLAESCVDWMELEREVCRCCVRSRPTVPMRMERVLFALVSPERRLMIRPKRPVASPSGGKPDTLLCPTAGLGWLKRRRPACRPIRRGAWRLRVRCGRFWGREVEG